MTKEINKNIRFNSEIQKIEKVNPLFSKATIRVLYTGFNRNGSYFSKDSVLKSIDSIYNIPLVGEYIEHADNFGDHGTSLEIKGNEIKLVQSTKPYGLIPESANIYWEDITEKNGDVNEYLIVDGAFLWTGRYEELNTMLEQPFNQSMEIQVINGNFAVIDGVETFNVDEFLFSALCILGIDKDGEGHVEPAFESANITTYSLDKDDFKKQFSQMVAELKFSLEKGGNEMEKEIPAIPVEPVTFTLDMFTEAQFAEVVEMNRLFDNPEPEATPDATSQEFALTASQLREQLRIAIGKEKHTDQWGDICRKYWYVDHTDTVVIVEDYQDGFQLYSVGYTLTGDTVEIQKDTAFKVKVEYVPFEGESTAFSASFERFEKQDEQVAPVVDNTFKESYETLTTDHEILKGQLEELQAYKRASQESALQAKFEGKLSDEEFTQVFTESKDEALETVEDKLFALIGKKNFSTQKPLEVNTNKIKLASQKEDEKSSNPYDALKDYLN